MMTREEHQHLVISIKAAVVIGQAILIGAFIVAIGVCWGLDPDGRLLQQNLGLSPAWARSVQGVLFMFPVLIVINRWHARAKNLMGGRDA